MTRRTRGLSSRRNRQSFVMALLPSVMALCVTFVVSGCRFNPVATVQTGDASIPLTCGNGQLDPNEECDGTDLGGNDCTTIADGFVRGDLHCTSACRFDVLDCVGVLCGNGHIDSNEDCDQKDLGGKDCTTVPGGFEGGILACTAGCRFDTASCTRPGCGNGRKDPGEECDDGNQSNDDDCLMNCMLATCGDGHVWTGHEDCDDGDVDTATCDSDCTSVLCGDGHRNVVAGEACDDGTQDDTDDCLDGASGLCVPATCGDGYVWVGHEDCDGGDHETATCNRDCTTSVCGDGVVNKTAGEDCDDQNHTSGDGCDDHCFIEPFFGCNGEPSDCACTVYVNGPAANDGDGATWAQSIDDVQSGVDEAAQRIQDYGYDFCTVWVAKGTYRSNNDWAVVGFTQDQDPRPNHVYLFGGFAGNEINLADRDFTANVTNLDGEQSKSHVIVVDNVSDIRVDGFVIERGRATDGHSGTGTGGGLVAWTAKDLVVVNCELDNNQADVAGGGLYASFGTTLTLHNVLIAGNQSRNGGGLAVAHADTTVDISRCWFVHNATVHDFSSTPTNPTGGGLFVNASQVLIQDSVFLRNYAAISAGAAEVWGAGATVALVNCTVADNRTEYSQGDLGTLRNYQAVLLVVNSIVWGNIGTTSISTSTAGGTTTVRYSDIANWPEDATNGVLSRDPMFVDPSSQNYHLKAGSVCIDAADGDAASDWDIEWSTRYDDSNTANTGRGAVPYVDIGAFEYRP